MNNIGNALSKSFIDHQQIMSDILHQWYSMYEVTICHIARKIVFAAENGNKVLIFGNGGSAGDSQHFAAELVGRFQLERKPLPAVALTTDTSIITAVGNDYSFDTIFERQINALGNPADIAIGISTSGFSENVIRGLELAKKKGLITVGLTGWIHDDSRPNVKSICDYSLSVKSKTTARIQEAHIMLIHMICEVVDILISEGDKYEIGETPEG